MLIAASSALAALMLLMASGYLLDDHLMALDLVILGGYGCARVTMMTRSRSLEMLPHSGTL